MKKKLVWGLHIVPCTGVRVKSWWVVAEPYIGTAFSLGRCYTRAPDLAQSRVENKQVVDRLLSPLVYQIPPRKYPFLRLGVCFADGYVTSTSYSAAQSQQLRPDRYNISHIYSSTKRKQNIVLIYTLAQSKCKKQMTANHAN